MLHWVLGILFRIQKQVCTKYEFCLYMKVILCETNIMNVEYKNIDAKIWVLTDKPQCRKHV